MQPRNQPRLLPSLGEQPAEEFVCSEFASLGFAVGKADLPHKQAQPEELVAWQASSVLVSGPSGSGRTSLLRSAVVQFTAEMPTSQVVVLDPTTTNQAGWNDLVVGDGTWIAVGDTVDAMLQLLEQLENLVVAPIRAQRVLVVVDRIDLVTLQMEPDAVSRLSKLVSGSSRSGIVSVCSCDSRTSLDRGLRMSFGTRYEFVDPDSRLLRKDEEDYLVRPYIVLPSGPAHVSGMDLPLGPANLTKLDSQDEEIGPQDQYVTLGFDDFTHQPVVASIGESFVVTGGTPERRSAFLQWFAAELAARGHVVGAVGEPNRLGGLSDVIGTLIEKYDNLAGANLDEKLATLLAAYGDVVVFEVDTLLRTLRRRLASATLLPWTPQVRSGAPTDFLRALKANLDGSRGIVFHGGFRVPPFQSPEWTTAHIQLSTWLYLDPKPESLIPGTGGGSLEKGLVVARPHRSYGADECVCLIEGMRHELRGMKFGGGKRDE